MKHNGPPNTYFVAIFSILLRKPLAKTRFSVLRMHFVQPKLASAYLMLQPPK